MTFFIELLLVHCISVFGLGETQALEQAMRVLQVVAC